MESSQADGQAVLSRIWQRVPKNARIAFFSAFVMGLLVHLFMLTNKLPNHDEMILVFYSNAAMSFAGRWFLGILSAFGSSFSLPWVNGVISILALSVAAALIVSYLKLEQPVQAFLVSFALVAFPTVGNTLAFMYTADGYFLGLLLAILGVFLLDRSRFSFLLSAVLFTLSLGTYQAYICFSIALMAMNVIRLLVLGTKSNRELGVVLLRYAASLALSAVLYLAVTKVVLLLTHQQITEYLGLSEMGRLQLADLPGRAYAAYEQFFRFLFVQSGRYSGIWLSVAHLICGFTAVAGLVRLLFHWSARTRLQSVLLAIAIALIPLWFNSIYLTNAGVIHDLMIYPIACLYLLALLTWSLSDALLPNESATSAAAKRKRSLNALVSWAAIVTVFFSSLCWSVYTNQGYFVLYTKYENVYAFAERIVDRIETDPQYKVGMPVAVLGEPDVNYPATKAREYKTLDFSSGFQSEYDYDIFRSDIHFHEFSRVYLGVAFEKISTPQINDIVGTDAFQVMPSFPYSGCIQVINGTLVVKLGDGNRYGWQ